MNTIWDNTKFKSARNDANMTASAAVGILNITVEYLYMLEGGKKTPSQQLVSKLATLYHKPVSFFLKDEKNFVNA